MLLSYTVTLTRSAVPSSSSRYGPWLYRSALVTSSLTASIRSPRVCSPNAVRDWAASRARKLSARARACAMQPGSPSNAAALRSTSVGRCPYGRPVGRRVT